MQIDIDMKKYIILLFFVFLCFNGFSQQYYQLYYNTELQAQVTANHGVRIASEKLYQNTYEKQEEHMEKARDKIVQVVTMKNLIYDQLRNVNSALRQGKQIEQIYYDWERLMKNISITANLTWENPEYAVLITRFYEKVIDHAYEAYSSLYNEILIERNNYLMDSYDRQYLLNKIHREIRAMNGWLIHINNYLSKAKKKPYFRHIRAFDRWYVQDRAIIKRVITNYGYLTNPW